MSRFSLRSIHSPPTSLAKTLRSMPRGVRKSTSSTHALWRNAANLRRVVRRLVSRSAASRSTRSSTRSSNGRASRSGDRRCLPIAIDLDVIVWHEAAALPACKDVGPVRQRSQLETLDLGKQFGADGAETAHLAGVEFDDEPADGG